jgi:hypothetical protein
MRSKRPAGQPRGSSRCSTRTWGKSAVRRAAVRTAAAATSQDSSASQRPASIRVSTPMEQPGSKALRYRAAGNNARLTAYLRCSYQRSSKRHGSAAAWYMASK